jgi:hypothetical protein
MTSRFYGSLVPNVSTVQTSSSLKVSIAWWLVPSVMFYLLAIIIFR